MGKNKMTSLTFYGGVGDSIRMKDKIKSPDIKRLQKYIAELAVTGSSLRNQGAKNMIETAREYLKILDLKRFSDIKNEIEFNKVLDDCTSELNVKFPVDDFGAARKAINIFLFQASMNYFLSKHYNLLKIIPYLEVPLDGDVIRGLKKHTNKKLPRWESIKKLEKENSKIFQECATKIARSKGHYRVYLDIEYWRNKKDIINLLRLNK
ncbi:MAG: hypothetical protein Q7J54_02390 [Candidatus Woesearchaeota archaeon]|nr:hypothetical protein [Candidatus Woesearchaeota archaeon]